MPLYWTIDSRARMFTAVAEGDVSQDDVIKLLDAMSGAKALTYRKLFDGRAGRSTMSGEEVLTICAKVRSYHEQGRMGALAFIATSAQTMIFARLLGVLATADRPIKVFDNGSQARKWIEEQAEA